MNEVYLISKELRTVAKAIEKEIFKIVGKKLPFTLMVFTNERAQYISTLERKDSIEQIKKMLIHFENKNEDIPAHELN